MNNTKHRQASAAGKRAILVLAMLLGMATTARATTIDDIQVEGWYGSGVNKAVLVLDFMAGNGTTDSFAFGLKFDEETITGYQLLERVSTATPMEEGSTIFHRFGFYSHEHAVYGWMLDQMWYTDPDTSTSYDVIHSYSTKWWSYWTSPDGTNWSSSDCGVSFRNVGNGDIDGWAVQVGAKDWPDVGTPPSVSVPEPSTLVLALAGFLALLAYRRKR